MPPFINQSLACQGKIPTVIQGLLGLLDNPTVTPREKAIYVAGLIFTILCFLGDIVILAYICRKVYRRCRRRRGGVVHGYDVTAGHEEKGLLVNADHEDEGEQLPAYHDCIDGQRNNENVPLDTLKSSRLYGVPYLGSGASFGIHDVKESIIFPLTWYDLRDRGHVVQGLLDQFETFSEMRQDPSLDDDNNDDEGTDKEDIEPAHKQIVANEADISPTSKAAHMSPHKDCVACNILAHPFTVSSRDKYGNEESVHFSLTWDDMVKHRALIDWFLESHTREDISFMLDPEQHYTFQDNDTTGDKEVIMPDSKEAHLSPHGRDCEYCTVLCRPDGISYQGRDGIKESLTFPVTMDDVFEHKDLLLFYLRDGFNSLTSNPEQWVPKVQFDEDLRHCNSSVEISA
ncbi:MAG: hypothetical protein Q9226_009237 [Calogaya cf. arnoldii]